MEKKTLINNSLERKLGACLYEEFYIHIYISHRRMEKYWFLEEFLRFAGILILSARFLWEAEILRQRKYSTRTKNSYL